MSRQVNIVGKAEVIHPFEAQNSDELTLEQGSIVNVLKVDLPDEGWWLGEYEGRYGVFPVNYVNFIPIQQAKNLIDQQKLGFSFSETPTNLLSNDKRNKQKNDSFEEIGLNLQKLTHITATRTKGPFRRLPSKHSHGNRDLDTPPLSPNLKVAGPYSSKSSRVLDLSSDSASTINNQSPNNRSINQPKSNNNKKNIQLINQSINQSINQNQNINKKKNKIIQKKKLK